MFSKSATHRGAPFTGRGREIGILTHLMKNGLDGAFSLVRVSGEPGMGRRRLIAETLGRGPDAEWVHLAPGGVEPDFQRWARSELVDLLDTYPKAPVPSWALHTLSRWAPALHRRAPVPAAYPEHIPEEALPEVLGSAIGAVIMAVTGRTLVVVDAGIWPAHRPRSRILWALARSLAPAGAVMLAAVDARTTDPMEAEAVRTVELGPLRPEDVAELVATWTLGQGDPAVAAWLERVSGGRPFFIHEVVRWLEELGHVRVSEEPKRVEFLDPVDRLPLPLYMRSVMDARYRRLAPGPAQLLHLLSDNDGTAEVETLRELSHDEDEAFDEALAVLRQREFLLQRTSRRPVALASPLWKEVVRAGVAEFSRHVSPRKPGTGEAVPPTPVSPLSRTLTELTALRDTMARDRDGADAAAALARIHRRARGRQGPAWDGVRGRVAVLAARLRLHGGRAEKALFWVRWGIARLPANRHPALRRALFSTAARAWERMGRSRAADDCRRTALSEAWRAGHLVTAARLRAATAEGDRRLGRLDRASRESKLAEAELTEMGLVPHARLAAYTHVASQVDARRLPDARRALEDRDATKEDPLFRDLVRAVGVLEKAPASVRIIPPRGAVLPRGWGWGLDDHTLWLRALTMLRPARARGESARAAEELDKMLDDAGLLGLAADIAEFRLLREIESRGTSNELRLARAVDLTRRLGAPDRTRVLAGTLQRTPLAELPTFKRHLAPLLLHVVEATPPRTEASPVRLFLMGRPRVVVPGSSWPLPLWPEWWLRLWTDAVSWELLGEPISRSRVERLLQESVDTPPENLESVLHTGNELLRATERIDGGIQVLENRVELVWGGLWCDVRSMLRAVSEGEALDNAGDASAASHARDHALQHVSGFVLSGVDSEPVDRLRRTVSDVVDRLLEAQLAAKGEVDPETMIAWREGPARLTGSAFRLDAVRETSRMPGPAR